MVLKFLISNSKIDVLFPYWTFPEFIEMGGGGGLCSLINRSKI